MKNKLIVFLSIIFLFAINMKSAMGADNGLQQIKEQLITNIASKVAELKLVEKRGIIGQVTDVSNTQITLVDGNGNTRFADVDELTKFSSDLQKNPVDISDINNGNTLGILGLYNKESHRILSRFVDIMNLPQFIYGSVASIDNQNYALTLKTGDDKKYNIDIETTTKTLSYGADTDLVKSGFSKISIGENAIISGFTDNKDSGIIDADRVILFPDISFNTGLAVTPETQKAPISTGSGMKLTPITK